MARRHGTVCLLAQETYKPGDLPPDGYLAWHEWADVQRKAGIKQVECGECGLWRTPQELSGIEREYTATTRGGQLVKRRLPVCGRCACNSMEREP